MTRELSLIFTRDFSLFTCDFWHTLMVEVVVDAYGAPFSGQVIAYNGHAIECYRVNDEMKGIKERILSLPESHVLFSSEGRAAFEQAVNTARELIAKSTTIPRGEYAALAEALLEQWKRFYPHYMLANFLPGPWREDFLAKGDSWREAVVAAFEHDRHFCEGVFEAADIAIRNLLKIVLRDKGMQESFADFFTWSEAMELFKEDKIPDSQILQTRMSGYCLIGNILHVGVPFQDLLSQLGYRYQAPEVIPGQKEFKGSVAFAGGVVQGSVQCVFTYDQVGKFSPGSILVAPMTAPDYLPAMKQASAIITDEGGITCHAAITSRELKIPCVIGTKIATKILKDGDRVEVDTEKGIITIIS